MSKKEKSGNWFKRHKILTVIGALIVVGIIASAAGGGKKATNTTSSSSGSTATSNKSATVAAINQPANDGKLQFTVTNIQCNQSQVQSPDDQDITQTAGAPYCIVSLNVKNISTVAQTFEADSQYLYDSANKQYSLDSTASITLESESSQFVDDPTVNPGVSLSGQLVFDIPSAVTPTYAMMHDSSLSNGVKVNLQ
jgi:hypothetical protein